MIEVLLLHRHRPADAVVAGMQVALDIGSISPDLVAFETRKAAGGLHHPADTDACQSFGAQHITPPSEADGDLSGQDSDWPTAEVIELSTRRRLPPDWRPPPSVDKYDQLLSRRP